MRNGRTRTTKIRTGKQGQRKEQERRGRQTNEEKEDKHRDEPVDTGAGVRGEAWEGRETRVCSVNTHVANGVTGNVARNLCGAAGGAPQTPY